jgi:hypothetical protein
VEIGGSRFETGLGKKEWSETLSEKRKTKSVRTERVAQVAAPRNCATLGN